MKITCPQCYGYGSLLEPVLKSSVVDNKCYLCNGTGKVTIKDPDDDVCLVQTH